MDKHNVLHRTSAQLRVCPRNNPSRAINSFVELTNPAATPKYRATNVEASCCTQPGCDSGRHSRHRGCSTAEQHNGYGIASFDRPQLLGTSRQLASTLVPALGDSSRRHQQQHQTPDLIGPPCTLPSALRRSSPPTVPTHPTASVSTRLASTIAVQLNASTNSSVDSYHSIHSHNPSIRPPSRMRVPRMQLLTGDI